MFWSGTFSDSALSRSGSTTSCGLSLLRDFIEVREPDVSLVLQFVLEAAHVADALDRGRVEREDLGARDLREVRRQTVRPVEHRADRMFEARALRPVFDEHENQGCVGRGSVERESVDREDAQNFGVLVNEVFDLRRDLLGLIERRAFRKLHGRDEVALVLGRCEAGRRLRVE